VLLFFCVSTPVTEVNRTAYTASFMPTEIATSLREVPTSTLTPLSSSIAEEQPVERETLVEVAEAKPETVQPMAPVVEKPVAPRKMYHLVIASFPTEDQANTFMETVDRQQYRQMGKVTRGGKCRVYAARFDNRAEAELQLAQLRQTDRFKDAWLFISK
ncbi:MAG: SPOR domain-containing protein, partial [bacterium]|nr:SPOR domain-containing protein [bacterium]